MNGTFVPMARFPQTSEVQATVAVREETCTSVVSPLNYVQRDPGQL
jgi:hypothetical protein